MSGERYVHAGLSRAGGEIDGMPWRSAVMLCSDCGALVGSCADHDKWHDMWLVAAPSSNLEPPF